MAQLRSGHRLRAAAASVQVTFRGIAPSAALEEDVRIRAESLCALFEGLTGCRVLLEHPRRRRPGRTNAFHVRIELSTDDAGMLVITHERNAGDVKAACAVAREAFDAALRQLRSLRQSHAKSLPAPSQRV